MTMVLYPYTEADVARGFTISHGRDSKTKQVPIPADVLLVIELRRIADALERLRPSGKE
jgi:hypothetical protein